MRNTLIHVSQNHQVMGVLNITPDSFSDGGQFLNKNEAYARAEKMVEEGVDILDIGGESTRPYAEPGSDQEELDRILPIIEAIKPLGKPISVDTPKTEVMRAVLALDVAMIKDVAALRDEGACAVLAEHKADICLMHMQNDPQTMQDTPLYDNVVDEVYAFLAQRIAHCVDAGIAKERIIVDPGFGFGKSLGHNLALLGALARFKPLGCRLLVGLSRKSMLGEITGKKVGERMPSALVAAVISLLQGVDIIRTHDVAPTKDAVAVLEQLKQELVA